MKTATAGAASLSALVCSAVLLMAAPASAQSFDPPQTSEEAVSALDSIALLRDGKIDELDAKLSALQQAYERGAITDEHLMHEFRAFYDTNADLLARYDAWIAQRPNSYVAYVARGRYFLQLGANARGNLTIDHTTQEQLDGLAVYLKRATADLAQSIPLTAKPILTFHAMMSVLLYVGDDATSRGLLDQSLRLDPENFVVRYSYLVSLQTRWGGSLQKMLAFESESRAALSPAQLRFFDKMIATERAWLADPCRCR